ncbi:MAG TPA: GAF domain-containing protein, partial [Burkholderiales bacterium]|nr:GAF domain-containing protein [Burkholderiales bacterium]
MLQIAYAARYESGALADVLLASLDLNKYMDFIASSLPRKTAVIAFVDAKGTILAWHPGGSKLPGTSIEDAVLLRFVREQIDSVPREFTEEGERSRIWAVSAMSDFPESGLRVLVGISKKDLLATANQNLHRALWSVAVVTLLVFLGAWILVELGIRRQAARIVTAVGQFGAGNFDARIGKPYPNGEIGDLMQALDHAFARISRVSRMHAVLSGINAVIVRVRDRQELFEQACRVAVEQGNFGTAWIGAFDAAKHEVLPVAWAGTRLDPDGAPLRTDVKKGRGVIGRAIREKRPVFDNDLAALSSTGSERWARAIQAGYRSLVALPFIVEGAVAGHLSLYAKEPDFFNEDELKLLTDMAGNISFALDLIQKGEALADSEKKLDNILGTLQEVVWSMDPQSGHIVYVNAAIEQLTRLPAADFLAQPGLWRRLVHHDDLASMRSAIRTLLRQGKLTHEFRIVLADGEERTVESSSRVRRDEAGKVVHIDGTISNITERKVAEETVKRERALLRAVVDAIPERIYVKDREGRFLLQNSTNMKVRGVSSSEEILGKTVFDIFPRELAERVHAEDELVMTSGTPLL